MSWSPDSRQLAYVRRGRAWKVLPKADNPPSSVRCPAISLDRRAALDERRPVVFAGSDTVGLWTVSADGGSAREMLTVDRSAEADFHESAELPEGRGLIFTVHRRSRPSRHDRHPGPRVRGAAVRVPGETVRHPIYSQTGHLLYERETTNPGIWAVPFSWSAGDHRCADSRRPDGSGPSLALDGTLCSCVRKKLRSISCACPRAGTIETVATLPGTKTSMMSPAPT